MAQNVRSVRSFGEIILCVARVLLSFTLVRDTPRHAHPPQKGVVVKLRWLRGFTSVDLSDNNIDDACTQPLKSLLALRQLCRINLRGNDLGPSAAKALLESLPRCKGLQVGGYLRNRAWCSTVQS